jgi:hypothetical protein
MQAVASTLDPYCRSVPENLVGRIDRLVEERQRRTGEDAHVARARIEDLIWLLGVNGVERLEER